MATHLRSSTPDSSTSREAATRAGLASVAEALERLRYGAIQLTVHDGRLVQLEVTERQRFS
ncbi:MAG: YezD family protein [Novosphingobium sp.]